MKTQMKTLRWETITNMFGRTVRVYRPTSTEKKLIDLLSGYQDDYRHGGNENLFDRNDKLLKGLMNGHYRFEKRTFVPISTKIFNFKELIKSKIRILF